MYKYWLIIFVYSIQSYGYEKVFEGNPLDYCVYEKHLQNDAVKEPIIRVGLSLCYTLSRSLYSANKDIINILKSEVDDCDESLEWIENIKQNIRDQKWYKPLRFCFKTAESYKVNELIMIRKFIISALSKIPIQNSNMEYEKIELTKAINILKKIKTSDDFNDSLSELSEYL